ncbi:MAG: class I SAM-dependent DNA methyltransferase [bacterium]|nr:class I SAM-dependent DNA methyltransferase [bacterium]
MSNHKNISNTIWNVADLLRGSWKAHEYQDVILPFTVLKRLDAVLEPTKDKVITRYNELDGKVSDLSILRRITGYDFYNTSPFTISTLLDDPTHIERNTRNYINGFSPNVQDIFKKFKFEVQLERLKGGDLLYLILKEFKKIDLHPDRVPNDVIGTAFEDLIRRFAEQSNETAGEHYTPRDVVRLMTSLMFAGEKDKLQKAGVSITLYDPACGTGGMLTVGKEFILDHYNDKANVYLFGQELNSQTYAICKADMLLKGEDPERIKGGDPEHSKASTLSNDEYVGTQFDYVISNPPYGVEWKKDAKAVNHEAERGFAGRFGAGLPSISDGQLLFIQHVISKLKEREAGGSDAVIITNGSPLFTGDAGRGESDIRRWLFEKDYIDTIIALPEKLFFNTGIPTYVWIFSTRKPSNRRNKVRLVDARNRKTQLRKNLGDKRYEISDSNLKEIVEDYVDENTNGNVKIFDTREFGYRAVTIQRPLRLKFELNEESIERVKNQKDFLNDLPSKKKGKKGEEENTVWQELRGKIFGALQSLSGSTYMNRDKFLDDLEASFEHAGIKVPTKYKKIIWKEIGRHNDEAEICMDKDRNPESNNELKDIERVPLKEDIQEYFEREVKPYIPDAWIDESVVDEKDGKVGKVGYEIPFTRYFYKYVPPRDPSEIEAEIKEIEGKILELMKQV